MRQARTAGYRIGEDQSGANGTMNVRRFDHLLGAGEPCRWDLRPIALLGGRLILEDQAEQEMHVGAVGSAFKRLGSIGSPHLAQVPYVPSDIRFRAASI